MVSGNLMVTSIAKENLLYWKYLVLVMYVPSLITNYSLLRAMFYRSLTRALTSYYKIGDVTEAFKYVYKTYSRIV